MKSQLISEQCNDQKIKAWDGDTNHLTFLDWFFKNPFFEIAMSGREGIGQRSDMLASSKVYLLVNLFEKTSIMPLGIFL